jgi:hypothetical protein
MKAARVDHVAHAVKALALVSILLIRSAHLIKIGLVARALSLMSRVKVEIINPLSLHPIQQKVMLCLRQWFLVSSMLLWMHLKHLK